MSETNIKVTISPERNIVAKLDFGGYNDHGALPGLSDDDHPQYIKHSLATAVNDFLVASGVGVFIKKTLAEVKTILGLGSAAYTESSTYAPAAKGVTNGDSHDHSGGDGAQIAYSSLSGTPTIPDELADLSDDSTHRTVTDTEKSTWNGKTDLATVKTDTDIADALSKKHTSGSDAETTTTIGTLINGADAKATPVDADMVGLMDSAASNILKKLSWANIKATLKTYFDSLYPLRANNLSDVANAATAFGNIKQAATTSATGVVELATQAEVLAGTDTSRAVVPADLWALLAQSKNPLRLAQAINMTYAASGSSGITVADDDDIDFGTGDFTLAWKGALPDWTPEYNTLFFYKAQSVSASENYRYSFGFTAAHQTLYMTLGRGGTNSDFIATTVPGLADGTTHLCVAVVTRETALVDGSIVFYIDGVQLGVSKTIPAASPGTVSGNTSLYVCGTSVAKFASTSEFTYAFNRALSAAEVLSLYQNGISESDKWGNQTTPIGGCVLALESEGIQPAPGQWLDSSTNKLHALQPAEGSSLARRKKDFEYRWTNTWTGTHEAQYIGGVNQNVLPSGNIRIDSITMVCTATGVNVILGDGSDTDRFVASVALATYLDCTIANRNHDGTNRKLVIDPDGNLTGSITTTIRGTILD